MSESLQKISREDFYERIWNTPIVKLGKELGYSYLEMVQLCQKLNVPRPDGGYWFRLRNGGAAEKIALPPANPDTPLEIFYGSRLNESESAATEDLPAEPSIIANPVRRACRKPLCPLLPISRSRLNANHWNQPKSRNHQVKPARQDPMPIGASQPWVIRL